MTVAVIHIGLHKTGTTSFQKVCAQSRTLLASHGVLYPNDNRLTLGTNQHQGLSHILKAASEDEIEREIAELAALSGSYEVLLLSSEEIGSFLGTAGKRRSASKFVGAMRSRFSSVRYICTIRDERSLLKSTIREALEGSGVPRDGRQYINSFVEVFFQRARQIREITGTELTVLRYEDLAAKNLPACLVEECTGIRLAIENERIHSTQNKDARSFLMASIRMLAFNALGAKTAYSKDVNDIYRNVLQGITLSEDTEGLISGLFNSWIEDAIDTAIKAHPYKLSEILLPGGCCGPAAS